MQKTTVHRPSVHCSAYYALCTMQPHFANKNNFHLQWKTFTLPGLLWLLSILSLQMHAVLVARQHRLQITMQGFRCKAKSSPFLETVFYQKWFSGQFTCQKLMKLFLF